MMMIRQVPLSIYVSSTKYDFFKYDITLLLDHLSWLRKLVLYRDDDDDDDDNDDDDDDVDNEKQDGHEVFEGHNTWSILNPIIDFDVNNDDDNDDDSYSLCILSVTLLCVWNNHSCSSS